MQLYRVQTIASNDLLAAKESLRALSWRLDLLGEGNDAPSAGLSQGRASQLRVDGTRGWRAKVYQPLPVRDRRLPATDLGNFVLTTQGFRLRSHELHGIAQNRPLAYRLDSMFNADVAGRYKFAIRVSLPPNAVPSGAEKPRCRVAFYLDNQQVLDEIVNFNRSNHLEMSPTSYVEVMQGQHEASMQVHCEAAYEEATSLLLFSVMTCAPGETGMKYAEEFWLPSRRYQSRKNESIRDNPEKREAPREAVSRPKLLSI